ncbi:MAG TPA: hypothetical protein VFD47_07225, partial [Actinomycetota bacterium]|nr:hypothetical protein [Actinomycetota bacterium]
MLVKTEERRMLDRSPQPPSLLDEPEFPGQGMTARMLWHFFGLAFVIGWGIAIMMLGFQEQIEALLGEIDNTNPVFILVVWSPAMAASYLVWRTMEREDCAA